MRKFYQLMQSVVDAIRPDLKMIPEATREVNDPTIAKLWRYANKTDICDAIAKYDLKNDEAIAWLGCQMSGGVVAVGKWEDKYSGYLWREKVPTQRHTAFFQYTKDERFIDIFSSAAPDKPVITLEASRGKSRVWRSINLEGQPMAIAEGDILASVTASALLFDVMY